MPQKSPWTLSIPDCSLPTFIFKSATHEFPNGDRPSFLSAYEPETKYLTRNTLRLWSQRFAVGLQSMLGVQHGDRIMLFSSNSMATPVAFMGTLMAGGIYTAANPAFTARELAFQWANSEAKYLLVEAAAIDVAIAAAKLNGFSKSRIFWFDDDVLFDEKRYKHKGSRKDIRYWGGVFADAERAKSFQWRDLKGPNEARDTILALNYSSGTTGNPKGVMITHKNYVANTIQQSHLQTLYPDYEERRKKSKWLCYLPLYHAMAQTIFLAGGPYLDVPVYIMQKFDFIEVLRYIEKYRITYFAMVPPIAVMVAKHPAVKQFDLSSINGIGCGAAPLGAEASRELEKVWGGRLNLKQGWGMTEVTCSLLGWDPNKYSDSYGVGEPNANCEAMIVQITEDEKGNETFKEVTQRGPDHRGELWCRGPNIMKGYWKNPEATKKSFSPDGKWLRTGDIAYVDEEGCFFIVDRMKELIKVKGNQVAPAELEALILDHPDIADVAVIGVQTEDGDEKPWAYCVRQQSAGGEKVKEQDVVDFVQDKVIRYKRLSGCEFLDAIPKNPSGKILRRQLRDMANKKAKAKTQARL